MKTIRCKKKSFVIESIDYNFEKDVYFTFKHLEDYFGYPVHEEQNGILYLYDNSNYYTPIKLKECEKEDADFHFSDYSAKLHRYYKII
jgi:hypothetical protein